MHKQAGYKQIGINAYLYETRVATLDGDLLVMNTGGWVTQSTAKAINATLKDWGISHIKVGRAKGSMYALVSGCVKLPFENDRLLIRLAK